MIIAICSGTLTERMLKNLSTTLLLHLHNGTACSSAFETVHSHLYSHMNESFSFVNFLYSFIPIDISSLDATDMIFIMYMFIILAMWLYIGTDMNAQHAIATAIFILCVVVNKVFNNNNIHMKDIIYE